MAMITGTFPHLLQRIIPFEPEPFRIDEMILSENGITDLSDYFQLLHLDPLSALGEKYLEVCLQVTGIGRVRFHLVQQNSDQKSRLVAAEVDLSDTPHNICVEISCDSAKGLLYASVEALSHGARISSASWGLMRRHDQIVAAKVALVICTYNRPVEILRTIEAAQSTQAFQEDKLTIVVIDNATNLKVPSNLQDHRLAVFSQRNFGGAGGFTRGIIESAQLEGVTHLLLMDDDVEAPAEVLDRLRRWLEVLPSKVCLAGTMLDSFRRTMICEAGAEVISDWVDVKAGYRDINLLDKENALRRLSTPTKTDFGGWWFFAFSKSILQETGLPLPFFIRGDDVEFGLRLTRMGFLTRVVHGIAVWHEPFQFRRNGWLFYYWIRNLSVLNALHFQPPSAQFVGRVAKLFCQFLFRYDYGAAAAIHLALSDYLKGPKVLFAPADKTHERVTTYLSRWACEILSPADVQRMRSPVLKNGPSNIWRLLSLGGHFWSTSDQKPQTFHDEHISWKWVKSDCYLQIKPASGMGYLFRKDSRKFWILLFRMLKTLFSALFSFSKVSASYRTEFLKLSSESAWRSQLGMAAKGSA